MAEFFLKIVNMSISASWLVLAVLLFRLIFKKAPRWVSVLLWGFVGIRLICPFSIESPFSLIPSVETISPDIMMDWTPEISTGVGSIDTWINPIIIKSFAPQPYASANPLQILIPVWGNLWILGMMIMLGYTVVSYMLLRRKVASAVILRNNIYQSEHVISPFVLGIIRPKIYVPFKMDMQDLEHVVAHEKAHIDRRDHWWKPMGFLLLIFYWFNPLMWVAYVLLCRDIELACDEKVIIALDNEQRANYTQALVACSVNRRMVSACPLAFGEVGVKERVKSVMNYKKPAFWFIVLAVITCAGVAVCFLTNPKEFSIYDMFSSGRYTVLNQEKVTITLEVNKSKLPESIYTKEGHEFKPNEVVVYSTDPTQIYLEKVMISNESEDLLYFCFDFTYDLSGNGSFLAPFLITDGLDFTRSDLYPASKDLKDFRTIYPDAIQLRGHGPGTKFIFYVSKEACMSAEEVIQFDVICNQIQYEKSN